VLHATGVIFKFSAPSDKWIYFRLSRSYVASPFSWYLSPCIAQLLDSTAGDWDPLTAERLVKLSLWCVNGGVVFSMSLILIIIYFSLRHTGVRCMTLSSGPAWEPSSRTFRGSSDNFRHSGWSLCNSKAFELSSFDNRQHHMRVFHGSITVK